MITPVTAGNFEEGNITGFQFRIIPGQMRRGRVHAGGQQRHDCRIVAPVFVYTGDSAVKDFGGQLVLGEAGFDDFVNAGVHVFDDAGRAAHVPQFLLRFDYTLPVDQRGRVEEPCRGQMRLQRSKRGRGKIIVFHFDADRTAIEFQFTQQSGQVVHRVTDIGLHEVIGILQNIVGVEVCRAHRAGRIDAATPPDGFGVMLHDEALMGVKGPAVVAAQPGHVGRVDYDQAIEIARRHRGSCFAESLLVFCQ